MKVRPDVLLVVVAIAVLVVVALVGQVWLAVVSKPAPEVFGHVVTGGLTALAALLSRTSGVAEGDAKSGAS